MGWVSLGCLAATGLLALIGYSAAKSNPGHGSGAFGSGLLIMCSLFFGVGTALATVVSGILALALALLPEGTNTAALGAGVLLPIAAICGGLLVAEHRSKQGFLSLLYFPCAAIAVLFGLGGIGLAIAAML